MSPSLLLSVIREMKRQTRTLKFASEVMWKISSSHIHLEVDINDDMRHDQFLQD